MARREGTAPVCRVQVPPARQPSAMAHVSARTPPGRAARRPGNADLWPVLPVGAGTARERETSADDAAPCQRGSPPSPNPGCRDRSPLPLHGAAPFSCPAGCTGGPDHGRFSRRGPAPRFDGAAKPRTAVTPHGSAGEETPPVAVRMQARRDASSPDCAPTPERRPVLPVGAFTPAPLRAAGQEGVLPSSAMAQVSARTPPGRAARRPGNADLRSAPRGSAKPAPMTLRHANVSSPPSPNPGCCDRSPLPLPRGPTEPRNRTDPISLEDCQIFRV